MTINKMYYKRTRALTDGGSRLMDDGHIRLSKNADILAMALDVSIPLLYKMLFVECFMIPACRTCELGYQNSESARLT